MAVLSLLETTMATAHILVSGGIIQGIMKNKLRSAQKILRNLSKSGYLGFHSYHTRTGRQKYYFLTTHQSPFHEIQPGILTHDSITALFLTHLFRCCRAKNISLRWYPPFMIGTKESDGGVSLIKDGSLVGSLVLETDTGTQDIPEIREKLESYVSCLQDNSHRRIVFLIVGQGRKSNIQKTIQAVLQTKNMPECESRILCLTPAEFPPDMDILPWVFGDVPSSEKDVPYQRDVPSEGMSKNGEYPQGTKK